VTPRNFGSAAPRHWHLTRDIKPKGECPACDAYWDARDPNTGLTNWEAVHVEQGGA
jgi:hypothetical protein